MVQESGACEKAWAHTGATGREDECQHSIHRKIETGKQTGPVELAVEFAAFFEVSLDYLLVGKGDFAEEQKRGLRMAIALLSELEASL